MKLVRCQICPVLTVRLLNIPSLRVAWPNKTNTGISYWLPKMVVVSM